MVGQWVESLNPVVRDPRIPPFPFDEEHAMNVLAQCRRWHETQQYQKIIDTLEAIDETERTPEMDSELARAYNNAAELKSPDGRRKLRRAIELLESHEAELGDTALWNFRMGYARFYLDQEGRALKHFLSADEIEPGDEDTRLLIDACRHNMTLPRFQENFRERTQKAWKAFEENEALLRRMIDEDPRHENGRALMDICGEVLASAFDETAFELGFNGVKHELVLSAEGDRQKLFELVYFRKHPPACVLEHWNIVVGRRGSSDMALRVDELDVDGDDVRVWLAPDDDGFKLTVHCPKLARMKAEDEHRRWWMLSLLSDQIVGEIPAMRWITGLTVVDEPLPGESILLSELPAKLAALGKDLSLEAEDLLEQTIVGYELKPEEDVDADWRLDVVVGSTGCPALVEGYLDEEDEVVENLHADGVAAGFFAYPIHGLTEEKGTQGIFEFRDALEEHLDEVCGPDAVKVLGGATGIHCGYVDFLAWDLPLVLKEASEFFRKSDVLWAVFHTFRRNAGTVTLKKPADEKTEERRSLS